MPQPRSRRLWVIAVLLGLVAALGGVSPGRAQPPAAPAAAAAAPVSAAQAVDAKPITYRPGVLPARAWGAQRCGQQPDFLIHWYNSDLAILRQTGCVHPEKPFLYLLFGQDKAMLFDTGAGEPGPPLGDVKTPIRKVLRTWLRKNDRKSIDLIVTHLHGHPDHIAGDAQLRTLPNTVVIPPNNVAAVQGLFGITDWPNGEGTFDLGGRILDVVPIPGHDETHIAVYDQQTGLLLTGDTMYPGRIYINVPDHSVMTASVDRLVNFARDKLIVHVLGTHIEQRGPYRDYVVGTFQAPDEQPLALSYGQLLELQQGAHVIGPDGKIVHQAFRDFSICGQYPTCTPLLPDGTPRPPQ